MKISPFFSIIFSLIIGGLIAYFIVPKGDDQIDISPKLKELQKDIEWRKFKEIKYKDSLKQKDVEIIEAHVKRIEAEKQVAFYKENYWKAKQSKPQTRKDSIVYLEATNVACDSLVGEQDALIMALKKELNLSGDKIVVLDSITSNIEIQRDDLVKKDSLHVLKEKELVKKVNKKFIKGLGIGGVIVAILVAIF